MKKINIETIIISVLINLSMILAFNNINAKDIEKEIVEVPVEVPIEVKSLEHEDNKKITCTYEERVDGRTVVEFSDYSYAIINYEDSEYIFQPSCMGDWDMEFSSYEDLKMAMETYFEGKNVEVIETQIVQTLENEMLK